MAKSERWSKDYKGQKIERYRADAQGHRPLLNHLSFLAIGNDQAADWVFGMNDSRYVLSDGEVSSAFCNF